MSGDPLRQKGYALLEANLVIALLLALWGSVALLGEWHGHGLHATHASRLQVFDVAHGGGDHAAAISSAASSAASSALGSAPGAGRHVPPAGFSMPGGAATADLRRDWGMADDGLLVAHAGAYARRQGAGTGAGFLQRSTALISAVGHAPGDRETQARIAANRAAWRGVASHTQGVGRQVAAALYRIDAGWGRAAPEFDWLSRWADLVPNERLAADAGGRRRPGETP
ncbi:MULTISPECIES: hypothetical protein [unclassified Achromobacter]|uniref:hypothetical protein n=1 Tax=unclassified Achromobacter TaxID=2626865 RepID=UPI000B5178A2|nr:MULTISPECIES: hypothetical protein [unclassified Achromobacter]OWT77193.1 hypothetical protein CEY04_14565 [Achromobacter sp. HZ28]OWT78074.1 hypothetical protein CEY05_09060 [Achromobacter sp. HZ34]